jgi:UDP-glucose 4-epimerase
MEVLVTGNEGLVGKAICCSLSEHGHSSVGFDIAKSFDILQPDAIAEAASSCDAIVHSAALLGYPGQTAEKIMEVNLQGTWNVLSATLAADISRIVFLSSVDVLGVFKGERAPDFLPLDESHECYPRTPYAISKYLAEDMCNAFAFAHGKTVVSLRPPGVWEAPNTYEWIVNERKKREAFEWDPFWEYGAFIDVRDLADACVRGLEANIDGYHAVFVSSDDITTSGRSSHQLSQKLHPNVEWRGETQFADNPYRTLLSNDAAKQLLDWEPAHSWADFAGARASG